MKGLDKLLGNELCIFIILACEQFVLFYPCVVTFVITWWLPSWITLSLWHWYLGTPSLWRWTRFIFVTKNKIRHCDNLLCGLRLDFLFWIINVVMAHNMYHIISWWVILRSFVLHCLKKNLLSKMKMVHFLVLTWLIPFMYDMVVLDM